MHERASLHLERLFTESGENVSWWKGKPDELLRNILFKSRRVVVIVG